MTKQQSKTTTTKVFGPQPGGRAVSLLFFFSLYILIKYYIIIYLNSISQLIFATEARELGAREVAPDALLVKLPKKKRKIKTNRTKIERKSLWTLAVTSQCRIN